MTDKVHQNVKFALLSKLPFHEGSEKILLWAQGLDESLKLSSSTNNPPIEIEVFLSSSEVSYFPMKHWLIPVYSRPSREEYLGYWGMKWDVNDRSAASFEEKFNCAAIFMEKQ